VQDAIFSQRPKGIKRTCFFVGGKDMEKAEEVLKVVRETMFPPFQANTIIDPRWRIYNGSCPWWLK
jgi:zona occludens toxin (predicted ATPase)